MLQAATHTFLYYIFIYYYEDICISQVINIFSAQIHGLSTPACIGGLEVGDVLVSNNIYPS